MVSRYSLLLNSSHSLPLLGALQVQKGVKHFMEGNELLKPAPLRRQIGCVVHGKLSFVRDSCVLPKSHRCALALQASALFTLPMFSVYKILAAAFWSVEFCTRADVPFYI
jgi:hypothetical protein